MLRRFLLGIGILVALTLVALPGWVALNLDDLPEVDDADLIVQRTEVAPERNGYEDFANAARTLVWPEGADEKMLEIRTRGLRDPQWVQEMFARNTAAMQSLHQGVDAEFFQLPPFDHDRITVDLDVLLDCQRLFRLAGAHAQLVLLQDDSEAALDQVLLGLRASGRISGAEGVTLLSMVMASAYQSIALHDLVSMVRQMQLTAAEAKSLIAEVRSTLWNAEDWRRMWAGEYSIVRSNLAYVDLYDMGGEPLPWPQRLFPVEYLWQPNRTFSGMADAYRDSQEHSANDCRAIDEDASQFEVPDLAVSSLLLPNAMGRWVSLSIASPMSGRFDLKRCHAETRFSLVEALIAARSHQVERGQLPGALRDLVPRYIDRVPEDRFSGGPLRYSRASQIVYSVGADHVDAGGEGGDPSREQEPALSLAF